MAVLQQPVVQLPADGLLLVVELVDVPAALVVDLEHGPLRLVLGDVGRRRVLRVLHLDVEHLEVVPDVLETGRRFPLPRVVRAYGRHRVLVVLRYETGKALRVGPNGRQ